jgi:hypothetical protein
MPNPQSLKRPELVDFVRNAAGAIAAGKVTGFTPEQNAAMSAALAAEADALKEDNEKVVEFLAKYSSQVESAQARRLKILKMLTEDKFAMRAVNAPDSQYEAVGFDPPGSRANRIKPRAPSKLVASGFSNGVNKLKFKGNNVSGRVNYMIEANDGSGWLMIGSVRKRSFEHKPVVPGQRYEYRVRAEATRGQVSAWSNKAAVYDTGKSEQTDQN